MDGLGKVLLTVALLIAAVVVTVLVFRFGLFVLFGILVVVVVGALAWDSFKGPAGQLLLAFGALGIITSLADFVFKNWVFGLGIAGLLGLVGLVVSALAKRSGRAEQAEALQQDGMVPDGEELSDGVTVAPRLAADKAGNASAADGP